MRTIRQPDHAYVYTLSAVHPPVASVACNESVRIQTIDAFEGRLRSESDLYSEKCPGPPRANPQTGPIYIPGAEPGDTLVVTIEDIEPTEGYAVTALIPEFGGLTGTTQTATLDEPLPESTRLLPIEDGTLRFNESTTIPLQPFLGTLGTAPDLEAISSLVPGYWGGNMDCVETCPGSSVWLPVLNEGALFFVGDAHACQGDGELTGVAAEMSACVTLSFALKKNYCIHWPRIETDDYLMAVGSARPLEDAARIAWKELIGWLVADYHFDALEAYQLLGLVGEMRLGNMVDPNYSMVAKLNKRWLPSVPGTGSA
ncbi:acetamidase/formamidase family protein [Aeoliella sp. ICT_H6.2]|uniref:Acetamidase/formamidase family protein n=1 Tax=Aeoliella straminimaris TaxID=2954799 RepID=A0A9X2JF74_9BACT|nr:acetamidase/formamidase family protein [Aeoliella straminimaris]MCO6043406.1 acetamidase/formamidase family protein [Aeoliella straminimaris]